MFSSFFNAAAAGGYEIEQSLRFDGSSGFTRTHSNNNASSDFTLSMWIKKTYNGENNMMLLHTNTDPRYSYVSFGESSGDADLLTARGTASGYAFNTSRKYRDPSAWYHLVLSVDAGTLTKGYINGVLDQNTGATSGWYFNGTDPLGLGRTAAGGNYFNGYMAEVHFIDGQALDADSFGEFDNGVWRPKRYTGSHGTNGFYLKFDPSATNGIGHDHSGNGNHWTANGFSTGTVDYAATGADPSSKILGGSYQDFWDGNTSTGIIIGQGAYVQMTSTSLPVATSTVGFYTGNGASTAYLRINGTEEFSATSTTIQWWDFSFSGTINKVEIGYLGGSGSSNTFSAFRIDGTTIVGTPGKDLDVLSDTPTTNWATLNPVDNGGATLAEGNLSWDSGSNQGTRSTFFVDSGKWYWELTSNESNLIGEHGVADASQGITGGTAYPGYAASSWGFSNSTGNKANNNSFTNIATTGSQNDVIMVALDMDDGKIWWGRNGTWFSSGDPAAGSNAAFTNLSGYNVSPMSGVGGAAAGAVIYNFGQRAFAYTPPTGFKALNTSNLSAPTVKDGSDYFNTLLWSGNNATSRSLTGVGFEPDLVWIKRRNSSTYTHILFDQVRGAGNQLISSSTGAELASASNVAGKVSSFDSDGFTVAQGTNVEGVNKTGGTYVAWSWDAGGSGSTNTAGSITSTVSANPTAGFSIVSYTGTNADDATVGHGLGVKPAFIIVKNRDYTDYWMVEHPALASNKNLVLNLTNTETAWGSGVVKATNSTVFTLKTNVSGSNENHNRSGNKYIAYCFSEVEGYSKFGSYTGNGNPDGVFIHLGFKPAFFMLKSYSAAGEWLIIDSKRDPYNVTEAVLEAHDPTNEAGAEDADMDFLSNGIKFRNTGYFNTSGRQFIFMALAENPFGGSGVSPATAR
jgi:hypothetical protein